MAAPVVHFEIGGRDVAKLCDFYVALFDWKIDMTDPSYGLVTDEGGGIGGGIMQIREDMRPYVTVYVSVDDLGAALERAQSLGGSILLGPTPLPSIGEFALFSDPEGNLIGLFSDDTGRRAAVRGEGEIDEVR